MNDLARGGAAQPLSAADAFKVTIAPALQRLDAIAHELAATGKPKRGTPEGEVLHSLNNAMQLFSMAAEFGEFGVCVPSFESFADRMEPFEARLPVHLRPAAEIRRIREEMGRFLRVGLGTGPQ